MPDTSDYYRSELVRQEAASNQASDEAARAARRAELEAQRTAVLRRVVQAEERVRAYETAAVERARLYDAADKAERETTRVDKRISELEKSLAQARQERRHCSEAAASHDKAYRENKSRWNDSKGAQRELQDAKNALDALTEEMGFQSSPKSGRSAGSASPSKQSAGRSLRTLGVRAKGQPISSRYKQSQSNETPLPAPSTVVPDKFLRGLRKVLILGAARSKSPEPASPNKSDSTPYRHPARTIILPAASIEKKRKASEEAEQAAKRARLSDQVKVEDEDPF